MNFDEKLDYLKDMLDDDESNLSQIFSSEGNEELKALALVEAMNECGFFGEEDN